MSLVNLPLDQIIQGDCLEVLASLPASSVDLIFADPPYNLQLNKILWRPNMTRVAAVDDDWDRFDGFRAYDEFCLGWLQACQRVLKDTGVIWVIGTYHNIYRLGSILQNLGFWFLNDIVWIKTNPMPNFRGVRFTNAHETLIWASKSKGSKYTFNHHAMKSLNDDLQMRSDWYLPLCNGTERVKINGKKAHSTQKPEALLYRILLASSNPGDVILDPFFGTGTTGVVAKRLHRRWIGVEKNPQYVRIAQDRIERVTPERFEERTFDVRNQKRLRPRLPFSRLLENGWLQPGQSLYFRGARAMTATLKPDGNLILGDFEGSIHQLGKHLMDGSPCNGWEHWYFETEEGHLQPLDVLREALRTELRRSGSETNDPD